MSPPGRTEIALAEAIDAVLPQTQCRQCGYAGCRPYAAAVASGRADINRCPPGGDQGVRAMAALTGAACKPLDPECGAPKPRSIAVIDESLCIGCTLCIQACPVDAIVGAAKMMHTVIRAVCTGCELCVPPCPVDCISLAAIGELEPGAALAAADRARSRYEARNARLERDRRERADTARALHAADAEARKRQTLERALERARARLLSRGP